MRQGKWERAWSFHACAGTLLSQHLQEILRSPESGAGDRSIHISYYISQYYNYIKYSCLYFLFHQLPLDSLLCKMRIRTRGLNRQLDGSKVQEVRVMMSSTRQNWCLLIPGPELLHLISPWCTLKVCPQLRVPEPGAGA